MTPLGTPQPIKVTSALRGPSSAGRWNGGLNADHLAHGAFPSWRGRLIGLVNSSLINTPSSSCSSVPAVWVWPGTPGMRAGEIPLFVIS